MVGTAVHHRHWVLMIRRICYHGEAYLLTGVHLKVESDLG